MPSVADKPFVLCVITMNVIKLSAFMTTVAAQGPQFAIEYIFTI